MVACSSREGDVASRIKNEISLLRQKLAIQYFLPTAGGCARYYALSTFHPLHSHRRSSFNGHQGRQVQDFEVALPTLVYRMAFLFHALVRRW
jgi:hypothetical protein